MQNKLPDERTTCHDELFAALRANLKSEVTGSAMLSDLLQKVNGMQEVQTCPVEFKGKFDEFVGRAEEYSTAIRSIRIWLDTCLKADRSQRKTAACPH
jgi:hypothetical protein